jgi:hypothetical protein
MTQMGQSLLQLVQHRRHASEATIGFINETPRPLWVACDHNSDDVLTTLVVVFVGALQLENGNGHSWRRTDVVNGKNGPPRGVELYSKYIMIMHRTIKLPIKEGNGIAKHDQHVAVAFQ